MTINQNISGQLPLVSIGLPVFNGEKYIRQTVESLLTQDYPNFELIISDNASTDHTAGICLEYAAKDSRIRFTQNPENSGAKKNFTKTLELSTGKYFMWAAHDDLWDKTFIRKCAEMLEKNPSAVLCCSSLRFIDGNGAVVNKSYEGYDNPDLLNADIYERVKVIAGRKGWYTTYALFNYNVLKEAFFRNVNIGNDYGVDAVLLMDLCLSGPFCKVPEVLFYYRQIKKSEQHRYNSMQVHNKNIFLPYTALACNLIHIVIRSGLDQPVKQRLTTELIQIFLSDPNWDYRFKQYAYADSSDNFRTTEEYKKFFNSLPFDPNKLLPFISHRSEKKDSTDIRCALIEFNPYHDHVIPNMIYLLNELGIAADVFMSDSAIRNGIFECNKNIRFSLCPIENLMFRFYEKAFQFFNYDFVIINSLEPKHLLQRTNIINIPIIGIIHNAGLLITDSDYKNFFSGHNRVPLVLAKHIAKLYHEDNWVSPVYLCDNTLPVQKKKTVSFAVTGIFDARRNYNSLLDAVKKLVSNGFSDFKIKIVGHSETRWGILFKQKVVQLGLSDFFSYTRGRINHKDFYSIIEDNDFILPLLDQTDNIYLPYFKEKYNSTMGISIGLGIIPVLHKKLSEIYELSDCGIIYEDNQLSDALLKSMKCDNDTLDKYRKALYKKKKLLLDASKNNLRNILRELNVYDSRRQKDERVTWEDIKSLSNVQYRKTESSFVTANKSSEEMVTDEGKVENMISPVSYKKREAYHSYISPHILSMIEGHPRRILEVGCAEGAMGQVIKEKYHCEYIGLEISRDSCAKAETRLDRAIVADVEKADLKDYSLSEKGFDYIIYADVLEHLYDPWTVICGHKEFLKDDGYIVASIPNIRNLEIIQSLAGGNWTYKEEGILDSTHLRFFTFAEIKKMFTNCGYTITDVKHIMQRFFEIDKVQGHINIELPKLTIKNVTKEEAIEFSTLQFVVKARKSVVSESDRPFFSEQVPKTEKLTDSPLVSICIPTFNGEEFLSEAIASALSQTYPNIEIIISDDGSTDRTVEIANSFREKTPTRFTVIPHENYGLARNWNFCISRAKGKYIKFLHQDDVLEPDCVKEMLTVAEQDDEIGLVFSARAILMSEAVKSDPACLSYYEKVKETCRHWSELESVQPGQKLLNDPNLLRTPINKIGEPTNVLIGRDVFDKVGAFDPDLCQLIDVEMWLRIMSRFKIGFVDKILSHWRFHPRQAAFQNVHRDLMTTEYRKFYEKIQGNICYPEQLRREVSQYIPRLSEDFELDKDSIEKAKNFSTQGSVLLSKGDTEGALNAFTKALELNPHSISAHNNLAILYWQTGHPQKSIEHFQRALHLDPNDRNTIKNCIEVLKFYNNIEGAKNLCSRYLQRNPGDPVITKVLRRFESLEDDKSAKMFLSGF